jgi:hypothetical protein
LVLLQQINQLKITKLIESKIKFTIFIVGALEKALQRWQNIAGQEQPNRIVEAVGITNVLLDVSFRGSLATRRKQLLAQILGGQDAIGEGDLDLAKVTGDENIIGQDGISAEEQRNRFAGILAGLRCRRRRHWLPARRRFPYRHDLITHFERARPHMECVAAPSQRKIAPGKFLNRPNACILLFPVRIRLRLERHPRREDAPLHLVAFIVEVNASNHKSEATFDPAVSLPRQVCDFVVAPGIRRYQLRH